MKNDQTKEPEFLDPTTAIILTNAEADELRAELDAVMKELKAADQAGTFLSPTARIRLEARRDDLKRQLADAERKPTGPSATTENEEAEPLAFNEKALERALSSATPAERREFSAEVRKLGKAVAALAKNADAIGSMAVAGNVASDDDGFMPVKPYWED